MEDYDFDLDEPSNNIKQKINQTAIQDDDSDVLEDEGFVKNINTIDQDKIST